MSFSFFPPFFLKGVGGGGISKKDNVKGLFYLGPVAHVRHFGQSPISYSESSDSLASGYSPSEQPLAKESDHSGYEIDRCFTFYENGYI